MNEDEKANKAPLTLTIDRNEELLENTDNNKNFGYDTVLKDIGKVVDINFALKNRTLQNIKKILGNTKKSLT